MNSAELHKHFSNLRNGDKESFALIYNDMKKPVFTVIYRILESKELAEDVTHDVFIKLFVSPPDSSITNPRAWIFTCARNLAIDTLRKQPCCDIEDIEAEAKDEFSDMLKRIDMESAIAKLSLEEREILTLHINADLTLSETSKITGLSLPAVYRRYSKALKNLRKLMNGDIS